MISLNIATFLRRWQLSAVLVAVALAASLTILQPVAAEARVGVADSEERSVQFLPEGDDEVLIQFEQGDVHTPYVIGGLWNESDSPPESSE